MDYISVTDMDREHKLPDGFSLHLFEMVGNTLQKDVDYKKNEADVLLSLTGYVFLSEQLPMAFQSMDVRRKVIDRLMAKEIPVAPVVDSVTVRMSDGTEKVFSVSDIDVSVCKQTEKKASVSGPFSESPIIISHNEGGKAKRKKPRAVPASKINISGASATEAPKKPSPITEEVGNVIEKLFSEELKTIEEDPESSCWIKSINQEIDRYCRSTKKEHNAVLGEIYKKMEKFYGFDRDECRIEYMEKHSQKEEPSILRAVSDNEEWVAVFESIFDELTDSCTGK